MSTIGTLPTEVQHTDEVLQPLQLPDDQSPSSPCYIPPPWSGRQRVYIVRELTAAIVDVQVVPPFLRRELTPLLDGVPERRRRPHEGTTFVHGEFGCVRLSGIC